MRRATTKKPAASNAAEEVKAVEKKTAAKAAEKAEETKAAVKKAEKKAEEKAEAVKENVKAETDKVEAAVKKAADDVKTTVKKTEKKAASVKKAVAKAVAPDESVAVQFSGKDIQVSGLFDQVKANWAEQGRKSADLKKISLYINTDDSAAYYVINDDETGKISL